LLKFLLPILNFLFDKFKIAIFNIVKSRWMISFFLIINLSLCIIYTINNFYVYEMKKKYINLYKMKNNISNYIKLKFNRAVILGIVDFSMIDGITFDDIKISNEEDFSNNKLFFTSQRINVKLSSIIEQNIFLEKVTVHNSQVELDLNQIETNLLINHFIESNLPVLEFKNISFIIKDGDLELLKTHRPISLIIEKVDNNIHFQFDDSFFKIPFSRGLIGKGHYDSEGRVTIDIQFNDYPLKNLKGILYRLIEGNNPEGTGDGFIKFISFKDEMNIEGDLNLFNFSGDIGLLSLVTLKNINLNTKFSYYKENDEKNKSEIYFKRKINNPNFYYTDNIFTNKNNLRKIQLDFLIEDIDKITNKISSISDNKINGKIKANLFFEETGKNTDWIVGEGQIELNKFEIDLKQIKFNMTLENFILNFNNKNQLIINSKGFLYNLPFTLEYNGLFNIYKLINQRVDYQIVQNSQLKAQIDRVNLQDFNLLYDYISNYIKDEIRERQEKMLPDTYVLSSPIYKKYIEKFVLNSNILVKDLHKDSSSNKISNAKAIFNLNKGVVDLEIFDEEGTKKGKNQISFKGYFDKKSPYIEFRTKLEDIKWNDRILDMCGANFRSDTISLNLIFVALGNNFSDMMVTRNFQSEFHFKNVFFDQYDTFENINLFDFLGTAGNIEIKGILSGYSQDSNYRNIELMSNNFQIKGYSSSQYGKPSLGKQFYFYGVNNGKVVNLNFINTKNKCIYQNK
jgi:hypothetical protein